MTGVRPFPDVDPGEIELAGHRFQQAAAELETAAGQVRSAAGTRSWTSPSARPAWDAALAARGADIANAREVMTHIGNVLRTTGAELGRSMSDYQSAQLSMMFTPDPRENTVTSLGDLLNPTPKPVDQQALDEYLGLVRKANQAVDDAEYVLALCAQQLMSVSEGVAFAPLPAGAVTAVDPHTGVIIPFAPAFGAPAGAIFVNGAWLGRGKAFEGQILRELGISGEAKQLFRPDAEGGYALPRTPTGLFRGTIPDSMRAGLLEIKSGTTRITMNNPQIRVQRFIARALRIPWNIIKEKDTPIDEDVVEEVRISGGSVYSRVPGEDSIFYDHVRQEYVRLTGGAGSSGRELSSQPLGPQETARIETQVREELRTQINLQGPGGGSADEQPTMEGPSQPYVSEQEYTQDWAKADVSPDGDTPLPGAPVEEAPGEPLAPAGPVAPVEPVEPVEPVMPVMPEEDLPIP